MNRQSVSIGLFMYQYTQTNKNPPLELHVFKERQ